ncbi:MAG: hypothetical protein HY544_05475 [Candidatus Diapherotrites archaeon]|uniref:Uncharacterized protein n=1 Tax=Candidatus Iainarchaeum sp. TaxID=3101447 RepID=A0A8T3YQ93_9ARCH|nr:hypothetical protein [Candidatus Diapherotrites archaeon]
MIGEQVNWIYVLIAGGVILLFFAGVAIKQREAAKKSLAEDSLKVVDSLTYQPSGSSQMIDFPNLEMKLACSKGLTSISIGGAQQLRPLMPVFGSSTIKSDELLTLTKQWQAPFRVADFVFLTSKDTRYIVAFSSTDAMSFALKERIMKTLPEQAVKEAVAPSASIADKSHRRIVIIGANLDPSALVNANAWLTSSKSKVTVIRIQSNDRVASASKTSRRGELGYCSLSTGCPALTGNLNYLEDAMLFAAIYSENQASFSCGMERAFERLRDVSQVYWTRTNSLKTYYQTDAVCRVKYASAPNKVDAIKSAAAAKNAGVLTTARDSLEIVNDEALNSACATIY